MTYVAAFKGNVPLSHLNNLTKARARGSQILIDNLKDPQAKHNTLSDMTEQLLVAKANKAVMQLGLNTRPTDITYLGAKKLTNRGIVFDLNSTEATRWKEDHKQQFLEKFSSTSVVKD